MIRRNQVNAWLQAQGYCEEDLILRADDAIEKAGHWRRQPQRILEAVLRATLPNAPRPAQRENDIVTLFIRRLADQGLPEIARSCTAEWKGPDRDRIYAKARENIAHGAGLARATEHRRLMATRTAAQSAGWEI